MKKLAFFTYSHFTVDFACFTVLFAALGHTVEEPGALAVCFLTYNVIAFGLQAPLGAFIDAKKGVREIFALIGAAVTALGLAAALMGSKLRLDWVYMAACMVVSALGNAAFHVGAGSSVLCSCRGRVLPAGIFNCAGALGVGLGTYLGTSAPVVSFSLSLAFLLLAIVFLALCVRKFDGASRGCESLSHLPRRLGLGALMAALLASIALHACASGFAPSVEELRGALTLLPALMICLGKLAGGALADKLGSRRTVLYPLALSGVLFALSGVLPILALPAIFLMNMSVPVTQCAAAGAMPSSPGFAFGSTKLAIALGTAVTFFLPLPEGVRGPAVGLMTALSALVFLTLNHPKEEIDHV